MADLITVLVQAVLELFFGATGQRLLRLLGAQRKLDDLASIFTGMAFWIIVGVVAYAITPR